jgi:transposase InsO family protein
MGLEALMLKRRGLSQPHPDHPVYPYLLRGVDVTRPNQVWSADITYIPIRGGSAYLVAILDWYSRKVLAWELSNTRLKLLVSCARITAYDRTSSPGGWRCAMPIQVAKPIDPHKEGINQEATYELGALA